MLTLTRKPDEGFIIDLDSEVSHHMSVGELFREGPIKIVIKSASGEQVRLGIQTPQDLVILQDELWDIKE